MRIEEGRVARGYDMISKKQAFARLVLVSIRYGTLIDPLKKTSGFVWLTSK